MNEAQVFFHVDIDSPATLLRFWGLDGIGADLDAFYDVAIDRALKLFDKHGIKATFFCVGRELEESETARKSLLGAFRAGHELANHTHTHPYALTRLGHEAIRSEIRLCSDAIRRLTGSRPAGFRAPSYDINGAMFRILNEEKFKYDASASWSSVTALIKMYHSFFSKKKTHAEFGQGSLKIPRQMYVPAQDDWMRPQEGGEGVLEIPVTRTTWLNLPFYNNFHLFAGRMYRKLSFAGMNQPWVMYLMHLVEFVDMSDGIPSELSVHPNLKMPFAEKLKFLDETIRMLKTKYTPCRTDTYVESRRLKAASGV